MEDGFDEVAKQLGITRKTAILNHCPAILSERTQEKETLSLALHLLTEMIRRESPELITKLDSQLNRLWGQGSKERGHFGLVCVDHRHHDRLPVHHVQRSARHGKGGTNPRASRRRRRRTKPVGCQMAMPRIRHQNTKSPSHRQIPELQRIRGKARRIRHLSGKRLRRFTKRLRRDDTHPIPLRVAS